MENNKEKIQLHLGCGENKIPGFINIDVRKFSHIDYVVSVDKLDVFGDGSADLIYACHILEHFGRNNIEDVLKEWYRVLKVDGVLRLAVPDFEKLVEAYQKYNDLKLILGSLFGRQDYPENTHYIVFDFATLSEVLKKVGFKEIRKYDWRRTIHKDYDDRSQSYIPHMDKENGILISLNIEAIK